MKLPLSIRRKIANKRAEFWVNERNRAALLLVLHCAELFAKQYVSTSPEEEEMVAGVHKAVALIRSKEGPL